MAAIEVQIVNAFVDGDAGGNPAGVVLDADALSAAQRLAVAQQVGLSETAFVSHSDIATLRLEFFTPTRQIAHCGHATIATFALLHQLGRLADGQHSKETIDGIREVRLRDGAAYMEQRAPRYQPLTGTEVLRQQTLDALGIGEAELLNGMDPHVVNTGNRFLVLGLRDPDTLKHLQPNFEAISRISETLDLIGFYPFVLGGQRPGRDASARMFAPRYGIREEAGTGMAAGPLACLLRDVLNRPSTELFIEQGWFMTPSSPSIIHVELSLDAASGNITRLMAGGRARRVEQRVVGAHASNSEMIRSSA